MKDIKLSITYHLYDYTELCSRDQKLIDAAKEATYQSYAPYSHFSVGAAAYLTNGEMLCGSNQENAAYPSGTCAERTLLFYANSTYPDAAIETIAIAARNETGDFTPQATPPCGACRQVMLETEKRGKSPLRILLYSLEGVIEIKSVKDILPLSFNSSNMK